MTTNLQRAAAVASQVELKSINLVDASVHSGIDPDQVPETLELANQYRGTHELKSVGEAGRIHVTVEFQLEAFRILEDERQTALELKASFALVYLLKPDAEYPDGALGDFARLNGVYNAWPYWRELVQTVSGRIGLSGIIMPVFQPQRLKAEVTDQPSETEAS